MPAETFAVLLVDGDEDELTLVTEYLERPASEVDCRVVGETKPGAALERVRSGERFDCVVTDSELPGTDGIAFIETVREHRPGLPALLFAADGTDEVAAHVVEAGVTDYLRKGYGAEQYTMLVRRVGHALADGAGAFEPSTDVELDRVCVVGSDGRFERVDDGYAGLYGYTAEEVIGRHWSALHPDPEVAHIRSHVLPVVREGGQWSGRSEGLRADGSTFTESKLVRALPGGRLLVAVSPVGEGPRAEAGADADAGAGASADHGAESGSER